MYWFLNLFKYWHCPNAVFECSYLFYNLIIFTKIFIEVSATIIFKQKLTVAIMNRKMPWTSSQIINKHENTNDWLLCIETNVKYHDLLESVLLNRCFVDHWWSINYMCLHTYDISPYMLKHVLKTFCCI